MDLWKINKSINQSMALVSHMQIADQVRQPTHGYYISSQKKFSEYKKVTSVHDTLDLVQ
jgi:hypothetical protein